MKCLLCTNDQETVKLWDGNHYCCQCLDQYSKKLFNYAKEHPTLDSSILTQGMVKRMSKLAAFGCAVLCFDALIVIAYVVRSLIYGLIDLEELDETWFLGIIFSFYFIVPLFYFIFIRYTCSQKQILLPKISISDGVITVKQRKESSPDSQWLTYRRYLLSGVQLKSVDMSKGINLLLNFVLFYQGHALCLDLAKTSFIIDETSPYHGKAFFLAITPKIFEQPICCNDPYQEPIWKSFFALINKTPKP